MKLKAAASSNLPPELLAALDAPDVLRAFRQMIVDHLGVDPDDIGPATHIVQETDPILSIEGEPGGIEVTLSKVSVTEGREPEHFAAILKAIEDYYRALIEEHVPEGEEVQLFVVLALDAPIKPRGEKPTTLPERDAISVKGQKEAA